MNSNLRNKYTMEEHREIVDITFRIKNINAQTAPRIAALFNESGLLVYRDASQELWNTIINPSTDEKQRESITKESQKLSQDLMKLLTHVAIHPQPLEYQLQISEELQIAKSYKFVITSDMMGYLNTPCVTLTIGEGSIQHRDHTIAYMKDVYEKNNISDKVYSKDILSSILTDLNTLKGGRVEKVDETTIRFYSTSLGLGSPSNTLLRIIGSKLFPDYTIIAEVQ